jgi:hypothetical protein
VGGTIYEALHYGALSSTGAAAGAGASSGGSRSSPVLRALPWYEGANARITSLAFSPGPAHHRLLCGVAGGGVYVIPSVRPGR